MKQSELNKMNYIIDGLEYTPNYKVKEYNPIKDENENIIDFELIGFKLIKSAEEVYQEWIEQKNNPVEPQKTLEQQLEESNKRVVCLEAAMAELAKQVAENTLLK